MADAQFTQEVTQSDLTLAEAIELEEVPRPQLMGWNAWMSWRKHIGKRPTVAADGGTTHNRLESQLWRATMERLYGEEWLEDLNEQGGGPDPFVFARPSAAKRTAAALRDGRDTPPSVGAPANAAVTTPKSQKHSLEEPPSEWEPRERSGRLMGLPVSRHSRGIRRTSGQALRSVSRDVRGIRVALEASGRDPGRFWIFHSA